MAIGEAGELLLAAVVLVGLCDGYAGRRGRGIAGVFALLWLWLSLPLL